MAEERYPGEQRALTLFLRDLCIVIQDEIGRDSILFRRIERGLARGDLHALREGRTAFLNQPEALRQSLVQAMLAKAAPPRPSRAELLGRYRDAEPASFVRFEADRLGDRSGPRIQADLTHELLPERPVTVLVDPGTLPSSAANALRAIADRIEADRRLLSERHWRHKDHLGGEASPAHHGRARRPD
ncbi:hypothetical protein [Marinivivus vitaminiproducens]|uniref:hypothetical protein n=1 Tax=Marinivivus vitaminiproducens TaxID=3035935 RepID=UPI0027AA6CCD|nr:hypothetical protein P4R82_17835 [Geminicoccaceae bacterium SCSIO 64248]